MLIRVRGYHSGIQAYLEHGQKQDREFHRDEMDERVVLAGNLDTTNQIIEAFNTSAERYQHITLSFKEDHIPVEQLREITKEFEKFAMAAYRPDEYAFYAETHLPRIKSYADRRSGNPVIRKPHIHIVIPAKNLLSGHRLEPFGRVDRNTRYIDAFQEMINHRYGFASPKDNRRSGFSDASEMISRYKGNVFEGTNHEFKAVLLNAVVERNVTGQEEFLALLAEYGAVRTRNAGRENEYHNVKREGAEKGINLKEYVFSASFIELDHAEKVKALSSYSKEEQSYVTADPPGAIPEEIQTVLAEWHEKRAFELKYLNSGSRFYKIYYDAGPEEQEHMLAMRKARFYQSYGEYNDNSYRKPAAEPGHDRSNGPGRGDSLTEAGFFDRTPDYQPDAEFDYPYPAAVTSDSVRSLSGSDVAGHSGQREMLLPDTAQVFLADGGPGSADPLRWTGDGAGREKEGRQEERLDGWSPADLQHEDVQYVLQVADKLYDVDSGFQADEGVSAFFDDAAASQSLKYAGSLHKVASLSAGLAGQEPAAQAGNEINTPVQGRAGATGRNADSVHHQLKRDLNEVMQGRNAAVTEFAEIKRHLDASRLLAALSHSHGVLTGKYSVTKGADGSDRIRAGTRNLNVSDFLTKEMHLSWQDASAILKEQYRLQLKLAPEFLPRNQPQNLLWQRFQAERQTSAALARAHTDGFIQEQTVRLRTIKNAYFTQRNTILDDLSMKPAQRKAALSIARMDRIQAVSAITAGLRDHKAQRKEAGQKPVEEQYRDYLHRQALNNDWAALAELRRMQQIARVSEAPHFIAFVEPTVEKRRLAEANEIVYIAPRLTHDIARNGDVTYQQDGQLLLTDEGRSVKLWTPERQAIEAGLKLSVEKFGSVLALNGTDEFKQEVVRVAAQLNMGLDFEDEALSRLYIRHRAENIQQRRRPLEPAKETVSPPVKAYPLRGDGPVPDTDIDPDDMLRP